jgi:sulfotransferase family protein
MSDLLPNFLHLGPSKSGSTWLHEVLIGHPEVYLTQAKDLYFFNRYYDRGPGWYRSQFRSAQREHKIIGEVCPDYLSCAEAPERVHACLGPDVQLMVTLREPISRAFSSYLYLAKHGEAAATFRDTTKTSPELLEEGRYATHLRSYLRYYGRDRLYIGLFDDLQADPQAFLGGVTDWLGIARQVLSPEQLEAQLPASKARWLPLAVLAKQGANWARRHDGAALVGTLKRSAAVQRMLYQPLGADRPEMAPDDVAFMHEQLDAEIAAMDREFGLDLRRRWGWH